MLRTAGGPRQAGRAHTHTHTQFIPIRSPIARQPTVSTTSRDFPKGGRADGWHCQPGAGAGRGYVEHTHTHTCAAERTATLPMGIGPCLAMQCS